MHHRCVDHRWEVRAKKIHGRGTTSFSHVHTYESLSCCLPNLLFVQRLSVCSREVVIFIGFLFRPEVRVERNGCAGEEGPNDRGTFGFQLRISKIPFHRTVATILRDNVDVRRLAKHWSGGSADFTVGHSSYRRPL